MDAKKIPVSAAERVAKTYGYSQVVIIARAVGQCEHVTTYGTDKEHCRIAAMIGRFLKEKIMKWPGNDESAQEIESLTRERDALRRVIEEAEHPASCKFSVVLNRMEYASKLQEWQLREIEDSFCDCIKAKALAVQEAG